MEKNIDTVIGRRFKKQGMSWTKEGASNPLKLRILCYHKNDWEEFWERENLAGAFPPAKLHNHTPRNSLSKNGTEDMHSVRDLSPRTEEVSVLSEAVIPKESGRITTIHRKVCAQKAEVSLNDLRRR
jgi:hypothetical protein